MSRPTWFAILTAVTATTIGTAQITQELPSESLPASFFWADYDADGLADAFVVTPSGEGRLLRNHGDGTLEDVTEEAGLARARGVRFALWEDVERDGDRDLLVGILGGPSRLFQNQGDATFVDATLTAGLLHAGEDLNAGFFDYDGNGLPDLYLRTHGAELLYRNLGRGLFESVDLGLADVVESGVFAWSGPAAAPPEATPSPRVDEPVRTGKDSLASPTAPPIEVGPPLEPAAGGRESLVPPAGGLDAIAFPACAKALEDQGAPGCLYGSSVPTLGRLYPLSSNLFVEAATGEVGIGTTNPVARLHVNGVSRFADDLTFQDDLDTIRFPAASGSSSPMIEMFVSGSSNADRMVLAQSPGLPEFGLEYEDTGDRFVFQRSATTPVLTVDLPNSDLVFGEDVGSIRFPVVSGSSSPMIEMFTSGLTNADRMVLAHSPAFPSYGLEYEDNRDRFVFQRGATAPVLTIDLANGDLLLGDDVGSIRFPEVSGTSSPMIEMFASGSANADRMVIGHSPGFPNWGLKYEDDFDRFVFQSEFLGIPRPTLVVELGESVESPLPFTSSNQLIATGSTDYVPVLDVDGTAANYSEMVTIDRTTAPADFQDMVRLRVPTGLSVTSQYIECEQTNFDIDFRVDGDGEVFTDVGVTTPADFAEMIRVTSGADSIEPGDLVAIDPTNPRAVVKSTRPYSTLVAGVYSTNPGVVGSEREWDMEAPAGSLEALAGERVALKRADMARLYDEVPVAVVGIVPCKVSAENGPIQPGELLVASSTPGHAMRADDPRTGTVVGKALGSLGAGTGVIKILVTLQ